MVARVDSIPPSIRTLQQRLCHLSSPQFIVPHPHIASIASLAVAFAFASKIPAIVDPFVFTTAS